MRRIRFLSANQAVAPVTARRVLLAAAAVATALAVTVVIVKAPAIIGFAVALCGAIVWCAWLERRSSPLIFPPDVANIETEEYYELASAGIRPRASNLTALAAGLAAIGVLTAIYFFALNVTSPTIVALSFLLVVMVLATFATQWVAVVVSLAAFASFNFYFLHPVGTFTIDAPQDWVALFTLLAVSLIASHLSMEVRRRAQEAAEQRKDIEIARRAAEVKSALLASLSHALRTPLTAVTVAANNLNATWLSEEQRREQAEIVRLELDRLNRLFQHIVDMARIEAHAVAAEAEWVQPAELIAAARQQVEGALAEHPIVVRGDLDSALVYLDPRLTSAALGHLLENAAQYSPPLSPIVVSSAIHDGELHLDVRDSGSGLALQEVDHVFERFYRGAAAAKHRFGTGMGLAIARGLLAAEGGRVWAANHRDGGAVFTIAVPIQSRSEAAVEEVEA